MVWEKQRGMAGGVWDILKAKLRVPLVSVSVILYQGKAKAKQAKKNKIK